MHYARLVVMEDDLETSYSLPQAYSKKITMDMDRVGVSPDRSVNRECLILTCLLRFNFDCQEVLRIKGGSVVGYCYDTVASEWCEVNLKVMMIAEFCPKCIFHYKWILHLPENIAIAKNVFRKAISDQVIKGQPCPEVEQSGIY